MPGGIAANLLAGGIAEAGKQSLHIYLSLICLVIHIWLIPILLFFNYNNLGAQQAGDLMQGNIHEFYFNFDF